MAEGGGSSGGAVPGLRQDLTTEGAGRTAPRGNVPGGRARFAFLGRVSTEDNQDPQASCNWQLNRATALIEPHGGEIVCEYFDKGLSRAVPPQRRPQASRLLAALADPARGFDAVVIGEPQRAFYGTQYGVTFPLFTHYAVPLWVPEIGGAIDPDNEAHDLIMSLFGGISKGERNRIRTRVRATMAGQVQFEGRFMGGRPPYGYKLADAGPHPNRRRANDGARLRALAEDDAAAVIIRRIFAGYIRGLTQQQIADGLTRDGVPSPADHAREDPGHRAGTAWSRGQVGKILRNWRYAGYEVWAKYRRHEVLIDPGDILLGYTHVVRRNEPGAWIWSQPGAHPAVVSEDTFREAQARRQAMCRRCPAESD